VDYVQMHAKSVMMFKTFGASLYGSDLSQWPSLIVDAFVILNEEQYKIDSQMIPKTQKKNR